VIFDGKAVGVSSATIGGYSFPTWRFGQYVASTDYPAASLRRSDRYSDCRRRSAKFSRRGLISQNSRRSDCRSYSDQSAVRHLSLRPASIRRRGRWSGRRYDGFTKLDKGAAGLRRGRVFACDSGKRLFDNVRACDYSACKHSRSRHIEVLHSSERMRRIHDCGGRLTGNHGELSHQPAGALYNNH